MPEPAAICLAQRAAARRAREVQVELRRGVNGLATIAATAALLGLAGTCWSMMQGFGAGSFSKSTLLVAIMTHLADALLFNAVGLVLAISNTVVHRVAKDWLTECEVEMALAISLLPDALRQRGRS